MAAQTQQQDDDLGGYAVAVVRGETSWTVTSLDSRALTSLPAAEEALRELRAAGASFGILDVDDAFFVIVRPGPAGTRLLLSDATAAVVYEVAEEVLDELSVDVPDIDADELEEVDPWEEGDLTILADLGLGEQELSAILADQELFPEEQIARIAERLEFDGPLDAALEKAGYTRP
ncbi:tRNA adenosine deaminase-associated protein [Tsukamurella sp. 8F]|uniref:tRNA adenosine deaminase-associated protein n=1 Tax=unclassified Tsukamurella TaxID=2633480 RepID=UPI0023B9A932|nr:MULTISPECIES: tRNA adenosine deaminase-associated protein [unclassified Tsukamurella]MDF0530470.1 tRNA adenosine deaminase-associated protein [Tsukamurella sp. 8J]MDF0587709.1 tRNA adenosine deaminase-associated protein [Tsukamurella sp. 8F]